MQDGGHELAKRATAHLVGFAFALTYLAAVAAGAGASDALWRGCITAAAALCAGPLLCRPVVDVILDALARDEARRAAAHGEEEPR